MCSSDLNGGLLSLPSGTWMLSAIINVTNAAAAPLANTYFGIGPAGSLTASDTIQIVGPNAGGATGNSLIRPIVVPTGTSQNVTINITPGVSSGGYSVVGTLTATRLN